jgi:hypothetical protein
MSFVPPLAEGDHPAWSRQLLEAADATPRKLTNGQRWCLELGWGTTNDPVVPTGAEEGLMITDGAIIRGPEGLVALEICWCRFVNDEPGEPAADDAEACDVVEV